MGILKSYFEFERPATAGEQLMLRVLEAFVAGGLCLFAWRWGFTVWLMGQGPFAQWWERELGTPHGNVAVLINTALITLLIGLGFFRRWERYAYLLALPLLHLQFAARYWGGTGLHHSYLLGMAFLAFALSFLLFKEKTPRLRFTLGAIYLFVGLCYFLSALSKLHNTGPDWIDGRNLQMWISMNQVHRISKNQPSELNAVQEVVMSNSLLGTFILSSGLLIELSGFLMCSHRLRPYYTTTVLMMHLGILAVLKIVFLWNIGLLVLLGYPWPALIDERLRKRKSATAMVAQ